MVKFPGCGLSPMIVDILSGKHKAWNRAKNVYSMSGHRIFVKEIPLAVSSPKNS
jgi:hypothetical protein